MTEYLTEKQLAKETGTTPRFWQQLRLNGGGPVFHKFGSAVRYAREDWEKWKSDRRYQNTTMAKIAKEQKLHE